MTELERFNKTYNYILITTLVVLAYVIAITFLPIPKENQRFVDIALAFLLGYMSGNASYLIGGNPNTQRKTEVNAIGATVNNNPENDKGEILPEYKG